MSVLGPPVQQLKLLATLGPASLDGDLLAALERRGVSLFRLNLSHTPVEAIEDTIDFVRAHTSVPLCLDSEGAQVRCGPVAEEILLSRGATLRLTSRAVVGTANELTLRPAGVVEMLKTGDQVNVGNDPVSLCVLRTDDDGVEVAVVEGGRVGSNKAVVVTPAPDLAPMTDKDLAAFEIGLRRGINHYALSFANCAEHVDDLRKIVGSERVVIAKIESRAGLQDMDRIIAAADAVLIDRGDLSHEIPIERVPLAQKEVIAHARRQRKPAYVATNLLESMITNRRPTLAEVNDIMNTLLDGADGLVLAAETAIGVNPLATVDMVLRVIDAYSWSASRMQALFAS